MYTWKQPVDFLTHGGVQQHFLCHQVLSFEVFGQFL